MEGNPVLMSLDELAEKYRLSERIRGIVHAGAHLAEEAGDYARIFPLIPVWWIEANPAVLMPIMSVISQHERQKLIHALLCEEDNVPRTFNVTNYDGMSSSIYQFGTHPQFSPDTVFVRTITCNGRTLDSLVNEYLIGANMLVMDIQGAEGVALAGAKNLLPDLDAVMLEVNKDEVYIGCSKVWDLDDILLEHDLKRVETYWVGEQGWGDALYVRDA